MERTKYLLILLCLFHGVLLGQNHPSIYSAYISGNMSRWQYSMDSMETAQLKSDEATLDLINYQYGYIAWCISQNRMDEATVYLQKSRANLNRLEQKKYRLSLLYAYKAAFVGFEIGVSPFKAPFIGSESLEYAEKSVQLDASNALGYVQLGNIAYYTPIIFGGSKTEALGYYLKALKIFESNKILDSQNWNYLNLLAIIINAYIELNQYDKANEYCIKTLAVEPRFDWVKNSLYPQVLKNLRQ